MHFAFLVCRLCLVATSDFEVGYRRVPDVLFSGTDYFDYFRFFASDRGAGGGGWFTVLPVHSCVCCLLCERV